jgi:hypothetical protein
MLKWIGRVTHWTQDRVEPDMTCMYQLQALCLDTGTWIDLGTRTDTLERAYGLVRNYSRKYECVRFTVVYTGGTRT